MQDHTQLAVWHKAMDLAEETYRASAAFPPAERFGLTAQMRRTAVSIPSNIAEGCGRRTRGEFLQFLGIAQGSLQELATQAALSQRLGFVEPDSLLTRLVGQTQGMLLRLIEAVRRKS